MTHIDLKPRGIKPPLDLLPVGPLLAVAACYPGVERGQRALESLPYGALCAVVSALHDGAAKYARWNWLERTPDDREVYVGAALRHTAAYNDKSRGNIAVDSGVHHLAHAFATIVILMEKMSVLSTKPSSGIVSGHSVMYHLMAFSHPTRTDYDEDSGVHRLALAGFLVIQEIEREGIGYHESKAVIAQKVKAKANQAELTQLISEQQADQRSTKFTTALATLVEEHKHRIGFGGTTL